MAADRGATIMVPMPHHPHPDALQTGDLLFPRAAALAAPSVWLSVRERIDRPDPRMDAPLGEYLVETQGRERLDALRAHLADERPFHHDVSAVLARTRPARLEPGLAQELATLSHQLTTMDAAQAASGPLADLGLGLWSLGRELQWLASPSRAGTTPEDRTWLLFVILVKAFPELLQAWLSMTVRQFLEHPLSRLLTGALQSGSSPGFFVGHVAMVLREDDGAHADAPHGKVWVIEANATDFAHYRVALHPYLVPSEPTARPAPGDTPPPWLRGWANRRLAAGESIWHSRHTTLEDDPDEARSLRRMMVGAAKRYLGRPYGFFDDPAFGDAGRFYCGEFVHQVFQDTGNGRLRVDQNRTWNWLHLNRDLLSGPKFGAEVDAAMKAGNLLATMQGKPFFLLTLPMLYCSEGLKRCDAEGTPPYLANA